MSPIFHGPVILSYTHLPITRLGNRDQHRKSIRGVSGLALEESKNAHLLYNLVTYFL